MKKIPKREFWITNISRTHDVSLGDLRLTIRRGESRNLLDEKHYNYTAEQLEKSATSGSIFAKRSVIKVNDIPPQIAIRPGRYVLAGNRLVQPLRSPAVKIETKRFNDLDFLDEKEAAEKFATNDAEIAFGENRPATLAVDKKLTGGK